MPCFHTSHSPGVNPKMTVATPLARFPDPTVVEMDVRTDEMLVNMGPQHPRTHGVLRLDLGTFSPFLYAFRAREMILDLFEEVCGARLTYSYITIGGAHDDLPEGWVQRCTQFLDYLEPRILEYHALLTTNHIFVKRTAGIGVLSKEQALTYACSGPMLRGSLDRTKGDPDWDLRKLEPYCGYETYDFNAVLPPFHDRWQDDQKRPWTPPRGAVLGDAWHRFMVRMLEVIESIRLAEQALDRYATAQGSHR